MTEKMNWDLLAEKEQQDVYDVADYALDWEIQDIVNALPPRLFRPRLPEGWSAERCAGGKIIVRSPKGGVVVSSDVKQDSIAAVTLYELVQTLLTQEGE